MHKKLKATNPINDSDTCFQYAATIAIDQEGIGKHSQTISEIEKIKPYLQDTINNLKNFATLKIKVTIATNLFVLNSLMKSVQCIQRGCYAFQE